ncbi:MAG: DUF1956 domain-containing protein [Alphaproteobacteria bacterium]|nr:MAG: DUF1956 domain-containing protein [Alphaproteobacteria bacterium]
MTKAVELTHDAADGARERLIAAGLAVFGEYGFHAATTRRIAERAGVNLAAIPYYFGTKENLYLAVAEHIARKARSHMEPALAAVERVLQAPDPGGEALTAALLSLLDRFAQFLLSPRASPEMGRFVLMEQLAPSAAFDILFENAMRHLQRAVAAVLGQLLGRTAESTEIRLRANMFLGQVVMFRAAGGLMLRSLGHSRYEESDRTLIRSLIADHSRRLLASLSREMS